MISRGIRVFRIQNARASSFPNMKSIPVVIGKPLPEHEAPGLFIIRDGQLDFEST